MYLREQQPSAVRLVSALGRRSATSSGALTRNIPLGITYWSSRLLADRLRRAGWPVSHATVARVWRHFGIQPHRSGTFKFSTDPELHAKVRDIVGPYLHPPEKAIVLCVDEKS